MPPQNKTTSPTIISDKVEGAVPGVSLIKQSMLDAKLKLTAQLCSEAKANDDTTRASHKEDTEYAPSTCEQSDWCVANSQASEVKLMYKSLP